MKKQKISNRNPSQKKVTLHRETLHQLEETELRDAAGQRKPTGPTCSGWPPCTC